MRLHACHAYGTELVRTSSVYSVCTGKKRFYTVCSIALHCALVPETKGASPMQLLTIRCATELKVGELNTNGDILALILELLSVKQTLKHPALSVYTCYDSAFFNGGKLAGRPDFI